MSTILKMEHLSACYMGNEKEILKEVSLSVEQGKIIGLVGESGCGKTTLLKTVIGQKMHGLQVTGGSVLYQGRDLLNLNKREYRRVLGNEIGFIVQDSISSLNPIKRVKKQIQELLWEKRKIDKEQAYRMGQELLLRLHCAEDTMEKYPFQLSGGQRQRVIIAMAFLLSPKILLADEPTTALDVTVQAQILEEMQELKRIYNTGILLISHNLGVVSQVADEIGVMYRGRIVEYGTAKEILEEPRHPYTQALLRCIPDLQHPKGKRLYYIPEKCASDKEKGCAFSERCEYCQSVCRKELPPVIREKGRWTACHLLHLRM